MRCGPLQAGLSDGHEEPVKQPAGNGHVASEHKDAVSANPQRCPRPDGSASAPHQPIQAEQQQLRKQRWQQQQQQQNAQRGTTINSSQPQAQQQQQQQHAHEPHASCSSELQHRDHASRSQPSPGQPSVRQNGHDPENARSSPQPTPHILQPNGRLSMHSAPNSHAQHPHVAGRQLAQQHSPADLQLAQQHSPADLQHSPKLDKLGKRAAEDASLAALAPTKKEYSPA